MNQSFNLEQGQAWNAAAFVLNNNIVNENGNPLEFKQHHFLVQPYCDDSPHIVMKKAGQVGGSVFGILRAFHLAKYYKANIIYTLPSKSVVKDFVTPKVDPLIEKNPALKKMIGKTDSLALKSIGDRFIYFRGSWEEGSAISISAHILINDEVDRCYEKGTEILTKNGWKKVEDITTQDKVLTRHPVHHNTSWVNPTEIIKRKYIGKLYRFTGRSFDLGVTENHRMFARLEGDNKYDLHRAKDLYNKKFVMTCKARWLCDEDDMGFTTIPHHNTKRKLKGNNKGKPQYVSWTAKKISKIPWFKFLGWYLSEGCIGKNKSSKNHIKANGSVVITQKNKIQISEIISIVKELGYIPHIYKTSTGATSIQITDMHLALYLQKLGDVYNKYIPKRWLYSNPKYLKYMLETLMKGDGDERGVYTTVSKRLADDIQVLCLRLNIATSIYTAEHNGVTLYRVGLQNRNYKRFNGYRRSNTKATVKIENYNGDVYCLTVPYHMLMVRGIENKHPIWSGNSNPKVLTTYQTRLDAAKMDRPDLGWIWQFSNPSIPGFGVDLGYENSDKKVWMIQCHHCNHYQYLDFPDNIDFEKEIYICVKCKRELTVNDRTYGRWVKRRLNAEISGYWFNQMMVPWFSAHDIIEKSKQEISIFYNFCLGKAYISKDLQITREMLLNCVVPDVNPQIGVAMGVDNGVVKTYVIGNKYGIFRIGTTESWQEIEDMRNRYNAAMVIDANPYPTQPKALAIKYRGKIFIHYYREDTKNMGIVRWGEGDDYGVVISDRTRILDSMVASLNAQEIRFNMTVTELEDKDYIQHFLNCYRITQESSHGILKAVWKHQEDKPDHFFHATTLWTVAMLKTLDAGGAVITSPAPNNHIEFHPTIAPDNTVPGLSLTDAISRANKPSPRNWKLR